jgi:hypothetical protein
MDEKKPVGIEAHGLKGMKSLRWRKKFKNSEALCAWVEKNGAEVLGQRDLEPGESLKNESAVPVVDNDYTYIDAFIPPEVCVSDSKAKKLNEGSDVIKGMDNHLEGKDEVGEFWVVTKPKLYQNKKTTDSTIGDILFKATVLGVANQVRGGLDDRGEIWGFYKNESTARKIAEGLLNDEKSWFRARVD